MVGLALVSTFSVIGASTNASLDKVIDDQLGADYVVSSASGSPFTAEVAAAARKVDGVDGVLRQRFGTVQVNGAQQYVTVLGGDAGAQALKLDFTSGELEDLAPGTALVTTTSGVADGSVLHVVLSNGRSADLRVAGRFAKSQAATDYVVPAATYESLGGPTLDEYVYVDVAKSADAAKVRQGLEEVVARYPVVSLKDQTQFKDEQKGQVKQLLLLIDAMLVLSIVIAVLGIVNTLALSVVERTREIGLLRAVGMGRRQLRRMVRLESVVISVYGATLGLCLGIVFGSALTRSLRDQGIGVLRVPVVELLVFLVLAGLVGVLAALAPARRAAKLRVLDAIATA